jgi:trk system potassium uptake protein TrkH
VFRNGELRLLALILPLCVTGIFVFTCCELYPNLEKGVRVALFETISAVTTTGFSTVGYGQWNGFGILVLIGLMLLGGGTCSTAGGIKQSRIHLLLKLVHWEVRRALLPQSTVMEMPVWEGEHRRFVDDTRIRQTSVFVFLYLTALGLGTLLLCACGFRLCDALFEMASATGTVGFSVQVTSAAMPNAALWAEILAMFLGRLEFMVVLVSLLKIGRDARAASTGVWKRG